MGRWGRFGTGLVTTGWYPAVLLGSAGAAAALLDAGWSPGAVVSLISVASALACAALEALVPETPRWRAERSELGADLRPAPLSNTLPTALFRALFYGLLVAAAARLGAASGAPLWPAAWPWPAQLMLALGVAEAANYAIHRGLHESRLWPLHAVHHSSQLMYFMLVVRKHPIQAFLSYGGRLSVLWLLGAPADALALYASVSAAHGFAQHSNIRMRTGPLGWVFATPELHRLHHSERGRESRTNYGDVLILWDLLLGTRRAPVEPARPPPALGLGPEHPVRQTWWAHLVLPFVWKRLAIPAEVRGAGERA